MWIDEYNHLMFKSINNDYDTIKAAILKNQYMPEIVYKYRSISDRNLDALENNFLMAASPSTLNDPYEGALYIDYKNRWKIVYERLIKSFYEKTGYQLAIEIENINDSDTLFYELMNCLGIPSTDFEFWRNYYNVTNEMLEQKLLEMQNEIKLIGDDLHRVCSFSQSNGSNPMWAHYGDNFKGYCVGYNFKENNNDLTDLLLPVRYTDSFLELDDTFFDGSPINKSILMDSLTRKSTQWNYEEEWRLLMQSDNSGLHQKVQLPNPKVIILGKDISEANQERLVSIADKIHTKCLKQRNRLNTYCYELVEL